MSFLKKLGVYFIWLLVFALLGLLLIWGLKWYLFSGTSNLFAGASYFSKSVNSFSGFISDFAEMIMTYMVLASTAVAYVFFIPIHIYLIKRKSATKKYELIISLTASLLLIIIFYALISLFL